MRVALLQLNVSDDPAANLAVTLALFDEAVAGGAEFILTPEMTNCISSSRKHQAMVFQAEEDDATLAALQAAAAQAGVTVLIGSLGLLSGDEDGRFANRSFLIDAKGAIAARYDKLHMFDVEVSPTEIYRESAGYRPGAEAVIAKVGDTDVGLTICYDVRFGYLFRALAQAGAQIITVPAAFNHLTGAAHWQVLLRARAIETGCYILAPAQTGVHIEQPSRGRRSFGHSMIIAPWGEVVADGGEGVGVVFAELDLEEVDRARKRVPSLQHDRAFSGPF